MRKRIKDGIMEFQDPNMDPSTRIQKGEEVLSMKSIGSEDISEKTKALRPYSGKRSLKFSEGTIRKAQNRAIMKDRQISTFAPK